MTLLSAADINVLEQSCPGFVDALERRMAWLKTARPDQLPDMDDESWSVWMMLSGRGAGKTRSGAEWVSWLTAKESEIRIGVIAPTSGDLRKVCFEGESGLLKTIPEKLVKSYNRSFNELVLINGSRITGSASTEPDRVRGQQFHFVWLDEVSSFENWTDTWSNTILANRLGKHPRFFISTTPKPLGYLRKLAKDEMTRVMSASTYANADNLAATAVAEFTRLYGGTRLGRQELMGDLLDDVEGNLISLNFIQRPTQPNAPEILPSNFRRIVIAVDPSGGHKATIGNDECGIVVAAQFHNPSDQAIILEDLSGVLSPAEWAQRVIAAYYDWQADSVVIETNFGGDMAVNTIQALDQNVKVTKVTASRGKVVRLEPVANMYEQRRIWHFGHFDKLEEQLTLFTYDGYAGERSPDRADAAVWALTVLLLEGKDAPLVSASLIVNARQDPDKARDGNAQTGLDRWKANVIDPTKVTPISPGRRTRVPLVGGIAISESLDG